MNAHESKLSFLTMFVSALLVAFAVSAPAQTPLLQPITVYSQAKPTPSPLVQRTGSSIAVSALSSTVKTSIPVLAEMPIPGYSGVLFESLEGSVVVESQSNMTFNPASNVKVATSYAVLKSFGP